MTITSYGYPGTIMTGGPLATWTAMVGRGYAAKDYPAWRVTAVSAGSARTVQVGAGTIAGQGITDVLDVATTASALGTLSTDGSRYDLIVARRTWQTTNATALAVVAGTASRAIPSRNATPGTLDDQPLALVKLTRTSGAYTIPEVVDLRVITSLPGTFVIFDDLALGLISGPGARAFNVSTGFTWERVYDSTGALAWIKRDYARMDVVGGDGTAVRDGGVTRYARLMPGGSYGVGAQFTISDTPGAESWYAQKPNGSGGVSTVFAFDTNGLLTNGTVPHASITTADVLSNSGVTAASGWQVSSAAAGGDTYLWRQGQMAFARIILRRSGAAIPAGATGSAADQVMCTITNTKYQPRYMTPVTIKYHSSGGGTYQGSATLNSDGTVTLNSLSPNVALGPQASGDWSAIIGAAYPA